MSDEQCPTGVHSHVWKRLNAADDVHEALLLSNTQLTKKVARLETAIRELQAGRVAVEAAFVDEVDWDGLQGAVAGIEIARSEMGTPLLADTDLADPFASQIARSEQDSPLLADIPPPAAPGQKKGRRQL